MPFEPVGKSKQQPVEFGVVFRSAGDDMNKRPCRDSTEFLLAAQDGDPSAVQKLFPVVYDELRSIAHRHLESNPLARNFSSTDLVHEVYLKLIDQSKVNVRSRTHFFALSSRIMRQILVDKARKNKTARRGGGATHLSIEDDLLTRNEARILVGTPMYIAPERITDPTCMDPRSDIFSLGVVAYYLLTGREPFAAADAMEALAGTMSNEPPPVSQYAPWAVPDKLERLVTQCQAKNVDDRISSVAELLQRLREIECEGEWTRENAARWWQNHAPEIAERSNLPQTRDS